MKAAPQDLTEDLQYKGLRILVREGQFRYGTDSVLLAGFVRASGKERVIDLGAGTGVVALLVHARTGASLTCLEIQPEQCELAKRSVEMNGLEMEVVCADMREYRPARLYDAAVCNPPYHPASHGRVSEKGSPGYEGAATHELYCNFEEVAASASRMLKYGGKFFTCCPVGRLSEAFCALSGSGLEPKRLRLVASVEGKTPYLALIEAKKGAQPGLRLEPQLDLTHRDGSYTEEADRIYHRNDR